VYHEDRLSVVKPCMTVSGTVMSVTPEDDGDTHFDLALDAPYTSMLTPGNESGQNGWLVVEIVPADKPGCTPGTPPKPASGTYDYGICTGANETSPVLGTHVQVTGPYVLDEDHGGWAEIHPVWAITNQGATSAPAASSTPTTLAPVPTNPGAPSPTGAQRGVTIISIPSSVDAGAYASLVAQASPHATCDLGVTLPSGRESQSSGLGPATADASGQVKWTWLTGTRTKPGTATATVVCGSASATRTFQFVS
jgi:hypothetical protein